MCATIGYWQLHSINSKIDTKEIFSLLNYELQFDAILIDKAIANPTNHKTKIPAKITSIQSMQDSISHSIDFDLNVIAYVDSEMMPLTQLIIGNQITLRGRLAEIKRNRNPHSFDYKRYMNNKGFSYLLNVSAIEVDSGSSKTIKGIFHELQQRFVTKLKENISNHDARNIAAAMVLGYKDDLSDDIKTVYRQTGSAHIIAVSGLHIDIIAYLLFILLGRNRITNTSLKVIQGVGVIVLVWSYALLVGSSASVVRAALMFTFYMLALLTGRKTNIWNILSLTALIMLMYNPRYIYDISFQFSFIGVISIVYFFPKIKFLNRFQNRLVKWWFDALCVSLVVQVLIAPISIYYFNYFPIGFLLSNSILIIFIYIIILGSVSVIISSYVLQSITSYVASFVESSILTLHLILNKINTINISAFEHIYLSLSDLLFIYGYIGLFLFVSTTFNLNRLKVAFLIAAIHLGYLKCMNSISPAPIITIYHCPNNNLIDFMYKDKCYSYSTNGREYTYHTEANRLANGVKDITHLCDDYYQDSYIRKSGDVIEFFDHALLVEYEGQYENANEFDLIVAKPNFTSFKNHGYPIVLNTKTDSVSNQYFNSNTDGPFIHRLQ